MAMPPQWPRGAEGSAAGRIASRCPRASTAASTAGSKRSSTNWGMSASATAQMSRAGVPPRGRGGRHSSGPRRGRSAVARPAGLAGPGSRPGYRPGRRPRGGRLVRRARRLPESLEPGDVAVFLADLRTFRDGAITLAMLLGGLRAAEVRSLRLAAVDMGLRRVRVTGEGGKERVVPVDGAFFTELAACLREERPPGCRAPECFVVLRGPTAGSLLGQQRTDHRLSRSGRTSLVSRVAVYRPPGPATGPSRLPRTPRLLPARPHVPGGLVHFPRPDR